MSRYTRQHLIILTVTINFNILKQFISLQTVLLLLNHNFFQTDIVFFSYFFFEGLVNKRTARAVQQLLLA